MPVVTVEMLKGRTVEQKRNLAKEITNVLVNVLRIKPEVISVIIREMDKENWATAGQLYSDK